jgi:predicted nucleic acid-binding protein
MPTGSTVRADEALTFVDTNVLVYAHDVHDPVKHDLAVAALESLWANRSGVLSSQVLEEFYVVATASHKLAMRPREAREIIELYATWAVVVLEPLVILNASHLHEARRISFWDALIVEAAKVAGASRILSEDLNAGETFDAVTIVDPFAGEPLERP